MSSSPAPYTDAPPTDESGEDGNTFELGDDLPSYEPASVDSAVLGPPVGYSTVHLNGDDEELGRNIGHVDDGDMFVKSFPLKRNKKCAIIATMAILFLAIISATVHLSGGKEHKANLAKSHGDDVFGEIESLEEQLQSLKDKNDEETMEEKDKLIDLEDELIVEAIEEEVKEGKLDSNSNLESEAKNLEQEAEEEVEDEEGDDGSDEELYKEEKVEEMEDLMEAPSTSSLHQIKASALTTIKKSNPDAKSGGMIHLSVEGDSKVSFIKFDLKSLAEDQDQEVTKAVLNLYLTSHDIEAAKVTVEALPHGGNWKEGSVSWKEQLDTKESFVVGTFRAKGLKEEVKQKLYELDVTEAITPSNKRMTFKLSTSSDVRLDFAGAEWHNGKAVPELMLTMSG